MTTTKAAATVLTLDDFDYLDVATLDIIPPGGSEPIGTITFAGPGHPRVVKITDDAARKRLQEAAQRASNRFRPQVRTPEAVRDENVATVVDRIISWSGIKRRDASGVVAEIPFTADAAAELLKDRRKGWLFQQCLDFLLATDSFTKSSAAT